MFTLRALQLFAAIAIGSHRQRWRVGCQASFAIHQASQC